MKALDIENREINKERLLNSAKEIPGAWSGIKIAALLMLKEGYRPGEINKALGLSRQTVTRWVHQVNEKGLEALEKSPPPGRPSKVTEEIKSQLGRDMTRSPKDFGLPRNHWNPRMLQLHLRRKFGVGIKIRQAQNHFRELDPERERKPGLDLFGNRPA